MQPGEAGGLVGASGRRVGAEVPVAVGGIVVADGDHDARLGGVDVVELAVIIRLGKGLGG